MLPQNNAKITIIGQPAHQCNITDRLELIQLLRELKKYVDEINTNMIAVSEHKRVCTSIIDKIHKSEHVPDFMIEDYKRDLDNLTYAAQNFKSIIISVSGIINILSVELSKFDPTISSTVVDLSHTFSEKLDIITDSIREINEKYEILKHDITIIKDKQLETDGAIKKHQSWFNNVFSSWKSISFIVGACVSGIGFLIMLFRSIEIHLK